MPSYFPEGNATKPNDNATRLWHKISGRLHDMVGNRGPDYFPEGSIPRPGDSLSRLMQKINAMLL